MLGKQVLEDRSNPQIFRRRRKCMWPCLPRGFVNRLAESNFVDNFTRPSPDPFLTIINELGKSTAHLISKRDKNMTPVLREFILVMITAKSDYMIWSRVANDFENNSRFKIVPLCQNVLRKAMI